MLKRTLARKIAYPRNQHFEGFTLLLVVKTLKTKMLEDLLINVQRQGNQTASGLADIEGTLKKAHIFFVCVKMARKHRGT